MFSTLSIPLFLAAIGIIFRGTAFALRGQAATINEARVLGGVFALSSVLIPFFLGAAIGGVASGRVPVGNAAGDLVTSWLNPTSVLIGVVGVLTGAYLAAVYLAGDSGARAGPTSCARSARARSATGAVTGVVALAGLLVLRDDARDLYRRADLAAAGSRWCSSRARPGLATMALVWTERYGLARVTAAGAVAAIVVGWLLAQKPVHPAARAHARRGEGERRHAVGGRDRRRAPAWSSSCRRCGSSTGSCCRAGSTRSTSRSTSASTHETLAVVAMFGASPPASC